MNVCLLQERAAFRTSRCLRPRRRRPPPPPPSNRPPAHEATSYRSRSRRLRIHYIHIQYYCCEQFSSSRLEIGSESPLFFIYENSYLFVVRRSSSQSRRRQRAAGNVSPSGVCAGGSCAGCCRICCSSGSSTSSSTSSIRASYDTIQYDHLSSPLISAHLHCFLMIILIFLF